MKKKVIINWLDIVGFLVLAVFACFLFFYQSTDVTKSIIRKVLAVIILVASPLLRNDYLFCSVLTQDTVIYKQKYFGAKQSFPVGKINKFVVSLDLLREKGTHSHLFIYANNRGGPILGVGNVTLKALMKKYPHIPVSLKCYNLQMLRSTAKYLVKHQKVSHHKCVELCKYYHISTKLLPENKKRQNQNDDE